jgi:deoxyribonuclease-4
MRLGVHVSVTEGLIKAVEIVLRLNCNTMQFFIRNPRAWGIRKIDKKELNGFLKLVRKYNIKPVITHACYIINLCSEDKILRKKSFNCLIEDLKRAEELNADYYVIHFGSHKNKKLGMKLFKTAVLKAIDKVNFIKTKLLVENTAGEGNKIGASIDEMENFLKGINFKKVGICIDTAHLFSFGYEINKKNGLNKFLNEFDLKIGLNRINLIHLNDSKYPCGSHIDRHQHIGKGFIGEDGFKVILKNPKLKNLPFILETPKKVIQDDIRNLNKISNYIS